METTLIQLTVTTIAVLAVFFGWYNKLSDPLEESSGNVYSFAKFFRFNWANGAYRLLSGILLLYILNDGGFELLKHFVEVPDFAEDIGDIVIAGISGLLGHKLVEKFV